MLARMAKSRTRPAALARAEHGGAPMHLTTAQRSVLEEALRLGEDLAGEVEAKVSSYGRWILDTIFKNDAAAALDDRSTNPIWLELVRRAGGPTLRIGRRMLYVALQLAAWASASPINPGAASTPAEKSSSFRSTTIAACAKPRTACPSSTSRRPRRANTSRRCAGADTRSRRDLLGCRNFPSPLRVGPLLYTECYAHGVRRALLFFSLLVLGCGSDKFTGGDGGDGGCGHELCDDFDMAGEVPGNIPPWSSKQGTLAFGPGYMSKQSLEARATLGSLVKWNLRSTAKGVTCTAQLWIEPAMDRDRTIAGFELDTMVDGGPGTFFFGVNLSDTKGTSGLIAGPGTLGGWGFSNAMIPKQQWIPFKMDVAATGQMLTLSAQIGPASLSGTFAIPGPMNASRMDFGAATLQNMFQDIVRWDNFACDSR